MIVPKNLQVEFASISLIFENATSKVWDIQAVIGIIQGIYLALRNSECNIDEYNLFRCKQTYKWAFVDHDATENRKITVRQSYVQHFKKIVASCKTSFLEISKYFVWRSLEPEQNIVDLDKRCQNVGGSSGAFFYFTSDGQYIIKTLTTEEASVLDSIIEEYTLRVTNESPSNLARVLGLYHITVNRSRVICVILMENLSSYMDNPLKFDMKGSAIDRRATASSYRGLESLPRNKVYKDIDFQKALISFGATDSEIAELLKSMKRDTKLLEKHLIMDYSLLLIIEKTKSVRATLMQRKNAIISENYVIVIGIIDFFQAYNAKKKLENRYKTLKKSEGGMISAIPPKPYRERFLRMIKTIFYSLNVN